MHMMVKKRQCKLVALFLLLVLLIPFAPIVPVVHVSAAGGSPFPFDYPSTDSFYPVDFVIRLSGTGHVMYMRVRTDTGQKIASWQGIFDLYTIATTPDPFSKYTFYDDVGNVVDSPFASSSENLELIRIDSDSHQTDTYGIVIASNADLYTYPYAGSLADGDSELYFYRNYVSLAVTPTPTPVPVVPNVVVMYGDYEPFQLGDIPNYGTDIYANGFEATGEVINIANALPGHQPTYASIFAGVDYDKYHYPFFGIYITDSDTFDNPLTGYQFDHIVYGPYTSVDGSVSKYVHYFIRSSAYNWAVWGKPNLDNVNIPEYHWEDSSLHVVSSSYYPYLAGYGYCDFYGFNGQTNPNVSPTPTPNPSPTLAPQPTTEPTVEPPDEGDDGNWTGLFGWIKKLINALLSIPLKIANGILNALKYVFVPDMNKIKSLWSTLNTKFGIQKPVLFEFDPVLWNNPENVVMHFKPISLNGEETEPIDVTIIDFDQVDDWLESTPGQTMIRIIQAVFSLTMWGYMIYIFRKHVATINYTDADTLTDPDTLHKGGDD